MKRLFLTILCMIFAAPVLAGSFGHISPATLWGTTVSPAESPCSEINALSLHVSWDEGGITNSASIPSFGGYARNICAELQTKGALNGGFLSSIEGDLYESDGEATLFAVDVEVLQGTL